MSDADEDYDAAADAGKEEADDDEFEGDEEQDDGEGEEEFEGDSEDDDEEGGSKKKKKVAAKPAAKKAATGAGGAAAGGKKAAAPKAPAAAAAKGKTATGAGGAGGKASSSSSGGSSSSGAAAGAVAVGAGAAATAVALGNKIYDEGVAKAVLLDYLNQTNRPYNGQIIHDNLHGVVPKGACLKLLEELAASGQIVGKTYNKTRIFWANQDQYGEVDEDEMRAMEEAGVAAQEELATLKARRKEIEAQLNAMSSALTPQQLEAELTSYRTSVAAGKAKLARITGAGARVVTPEERNKVKATLDRYRKLWVERKRMVVDVVESMAEGLDTKPKALYDVIGIETDEDAGVKLSDFQTAPPAAAAWGR